MIAEHCFPSTLMKSPGKGYLHQMQVGKLGIFSTSLNCDKIEKTTALSINAAKVHCKLINEIIAMFEKTLFKNSHCRLTE